MKAIILKEVGEPQNLVLADVPLPTIAANEVLVQVKAISVNPVDAYVRRNKAYLDAVYQTQGNEEHIILGWDVSGIVTELGASVTKFKIGDQVFGNFKFIGQANAYAEFIAAPENELVLKPDNVTFEAAAGATMAAMTAWVSLVNHGKIKKGDKVIIHGASGGVGHYGVQFAKHFGAYVVGVASGDNRDFVLGIGANEFIDYKSQRFEELVTDADIVHDSVWSDDDKHIERSLKALKPGGTLLSLIVYPETEFVERALSEKNVKVLRVNVTPNPTYEHDMEYVARLLSSGEVKTHISHVFPLEEMYKAHTIVQTKNTVGKIIVVP
ncbi:NADP-dependent oxidoreductase [Dyadobacter chenwenxiniae]|uniref:NADP-dependent oxidoreductase n=1 Tax=Dyadobacter chenwenxiniae TaxID=2906456 RepID=A0A9X1PRD8_9BACT|nr:NADP-dependent oxidoreductase [Dyadobacter chenwenxiniae]MCF0065536.1 NADP-dependent oxidoreductase [Dyadobacter chenwenxiniae]UON85446.1 NADP-dependent oxidoreductase [Dyadobacter chenwenxiniae]